MRLPILLLATTLASNAEFRHIEVTFQPTDCLSCTESLQRRLERVRGVESVEMDLDRGTATLTLEAGNKVRLTPLLSRITQDGTKITRTEVAVIGKILREGDAFRFQPSGLTETYRLQPSKGAAQFTPQSEAVYEISGFVSASDQSDDAAIEAMSVEVAPATR